MTEPFTFYNSRIDALKRALSQIYKKEIVLSYSRLASFITALLFFALLFNVSAALATVICIIFLILFGWLVKYHNRVIHDKAYHEHLIKINGTEAEAVEGNLAGLPDGSEYLREHRDHYYSFDLDIFGGNSLYRMVNRTSTKPGSDLIARWLTSPAGVEEIKERQIAVCDLRDRIEWRQKLQVTGAMHRDSRRDPAEIIKWVSSQEIFESKGYLRLAINALSIMALASLAGQFFGLPLSITVLVLTINFIVNFLYQKKINEMHIKVSRSNDMLYSYATTISLIEKESFTSRKLVALQDNLKASGSASQQIKELSQLVRKLDVRLNVLVSLFLNLFWFWDIRMCFRMEGWKKRNAPHIRGWFDVMAEIEALSSLANLSFNNPEWILPVVREGNFHLDSVDTGHPLIPRSKRVSNDLKISGPGKLLLITGSNMSGKSTFLRTIGVNLVLAYAGSAVCASTFRTAPVKLITSMRVSDSLEENTSTFYAELKRLSMIIKEASAGPSVFLLLDEILHGTNSNDRHIGSVALVRQLIGNQASGMVATHDLALSSLEREYPAEIINYNFDVKIEGEELYFDYKLNKGICSSMNATLLMKKMGIDIK